MRTLHHAAPVQAVSQALAGTGEAWLVGGVVRDWLMGRELIDVDIAVSGDPADAARAVGSALGGPAFSLSEAFGAWRAIDSERRLTCDVTRLQGPTIEEDLGHRDFTVNAMAVALAGGPLIDPHGGERDLAERRLRVLGAQAYASDPLRVLRAVRLAAELGLVPDEETQRLSAQAAPRLCEPSPERVFAELRRLVSAPRALEGLELATRLGVLEAVLPELTALSGIEQSRFHHLDVFGHTLEALRHLMELETNLPSVFGHVAPEVAEVLSQPLADDLTRGQALRLGALLHDVAKPATRGIRPDGRVTFVGHDSAGDEIVGQIFRRLRTSERLRSYVGKLTREHLALGFLVHDRPLSRRAVHSFLRRCEPVEVEVIVLSCADRMATRGDGQEPWIAAHLELGREMMAAALQWRSAGPPRPQLRGHDLVRELDLEPGPQIGVLLAQLEEAAYAGEASSREEELALVRRLRDDQGA